MRSWCRGNEVRQRGQGSSGALQIASFARQVRDFTARSDEVSARFRVADGWAWWGRVSGIGGWSVEVRMAAGTVPKGENRERGEEREERVEKNIFFFFLGF